MSPSQEPAERDQALSAPGRPAVSDAAVAFEGMRRQLAMLSAAVEGFAARQQELDARDYGPDLAKIHAQQEALRGAVETLARRPAMALTPAAMAAELDRAGQVVREADHRALGEASHTLDAASSKLSALVARARTAEQQADKVIWTAVVTAGLTTLLVAFAPALTARLAPSSGKVQERHAAAMLGMTPEQAGQHLLRQANPRAWDSLVAASRLIRRNAKVLDAS
jgi:hypothetical protein